jgi:hypothetical protein
MHPNVSLFVSAGILRLQLSKSQANFIKSTLFHSRLVYAIFFPVNLSLAL